MTYSALLIHDVMIFNPVDSAGTDRYGNEIEFWDAGTLVSARVDEKSSSEDTIDRDMRKRQYTVFLEKEAPISALSYMIWDTRELRVNGEPKMLYDAVGPHHIEVECEEVLG